MTTAMITVLFTDLVASTELLSRVGEERAEVLRREHFSLLRDAIDEAGGREVKNLGDGLMVAFDGPAAALSCAVAMQQRLAARPLDAEPLQIRVGVAAGEVDVEDGDYFGLPVVEAARLCAKADGGEILVTDLVRMLARSRSDAEMEAVGALDLKGLPDPVDVHRVRWVPLSRAGAVIPLPARLDALVTSAFVGRVEETGALETAFKEVVVGDRRAVLLGGEPGIGKTTLTATFTSAAADRDAWVLYGRCDEDLFVPYQPWIEALGHLVTHAPDDLLADHVDARGSVLARLVPDLGHRTGTDAPHSTDDDTERHLLYTAVADLLARAGARAPLVLVLDDLHWADEPTLQLLRHVLAAADQRVLVIGTFRDSEVHRGGPLSAALAALHRERGVERLAVRGLGDTELLDLLETVAGHEMSASGIALRDALLAETAGNPFFVTELLRHLSETGGIYQDDEGTWHVAVDLDRRGLPVSIREVVGSRVNRLGPETERVLTIAAVIGRDFDVGLLAQVAELSEDHVVDLCDAAVDAAVLRETDQIDRYTFAHALIERSLYDELSAARRARSHRAVAEALEERCGDDPGDRVGELAHHWAQATRPQDTAKAVRYAGLAGQRALQQLAPAEAVRWFGEALTHLDDDQQRTRDGIALRIGVGEAQRLVGDPDHRETLLAAAHDAADAGHTDLVVRAALANNAGKASSTGLVDEERLDTVRAALEALDPVDSIERARLLAVLAAELTFHPAGEAPAIAAEAVAMARRLGEPRTFISVVALCKEPRSVCDTLAEHAVDVAEAVQMADGSGDAALGALAHWAAVTAAIDLGDRDALERHASALEACADRTHLGVHRWQAAHFRAVDDMFRGDLERIDAAIANYLEVGSREGYEDDTLAQWAAMVLFSGWARGELAGMIPAIEAERDAKPLLPIYGAVLAWAQVLEEQFAQAAQLLDDARLDGFALPRDFTWLLGQCIWTEVAARLGDVRAAAELVWRIEPWGRFTASAHTSANGVVWHYAGRARSTLGEHDLAVAHLERAVEAHQAMRAPFFTAMSEVALAEALVARGAADDDTRARTLASRAHDVAEAQGYGYVRRDAAAVLDRLDST